MSQVFGMEIVPSASEYVLALTSLGRRVTDKQRDLLRAHYRAQDRAATSAQLAIWAGIDGGMAEVNLWYPKLGHAVSDELGIKPYIRDDGSPAWWSVLSRGWYGRDGFVWQMLPEVAAAIEELGWVDSIA